MSRTAASSTQSDGLGIHRLGDVRSRLAAVDDVIGRIKYLPSRERAAVVADLVARVNHKLRDDLMMTSDQVRELARAGMEIGAHTVTHSLLRDLSDSEARHEVGTSRSRLREITDSSVPVFAYPNGQPWQGLRPARRRACPGSRLRGGRLDGLGRGHRAQRSVPGASVHALGPDAEAFLAPLDAKLHAHRRATHMTERTRQEARMTAILGRVDVGTPSPGEHAAACARWVQRAPSAPRSG